MNILRILGIILAVVLFSNAYQGKDSESQDRMLNEKKNETINSSQKDTTKQAHLITFVELGSVKCIPCRMMQPVMNAIEEKYGTQINVIFYDIWKVDQKKYAEEYDILLIPTQVFLDKKGQEIFRHEGFFPEDEIDIFLQKQGLKPETKS